MSMRMLCNASGAAVGLAADHFMSRLRCCTEIGCTEKHVYYCDYQLKGKESMRCCDRALCGAHVVPVGEGRHYCIAHYELAQGEP